MRIYDEKAARIISIIYHGGPDAFRHLEGILRETKQECPEALEDVWRYCRNNAPVPGIPWEAALRDELFGGWDEDERKEDVAELEALHVPEEEAGDIFRQMLDDEWETKQELRRRNIAFSANTNAVEDMERRSPSGKPSAPRGRPAPGTGPPCTKFRRRGSERPVTGNKTARGRKGLASCAESPWWSARPATPSNHRAKSLFPESWKSAA